MVVPLRRGMILVDQGPKPNSIIHFTWPPPLFYMGPSLSHTLSRPDLFVLSTLNPLIDTRALWCMQWSKMTDVISLVNGLLNIMPVLNIIQKVDTRPLVSPQEVK